MTKMTKEQKDGSVHGLNAAAWANASVCCALLYALNMSMLMLGYAVIMAYVCAVAKSAQINN